MSPDTAPGSGTGGGSGGTGGSPEPELDALTGDLPPDAAARDAAKREDAGEADHAISGDDITFVTRGVSDEERAAVIAVLTAARTEESRQVKRVARRDREPWARSQRVPDGFADLLIEG